MTDPRSVVRGILVYALCLPLALVVGYNLAGLSDLRIEAVLTVGLVLGFLLFPILLRWHHPLLICSWNTIAVLFFSPGRPQIRLALAAASLLITLLMYALDRRAKPQIAASISWPLLFLVAVVLITAELTGGAGFGSFGSQIGGAGRYVTLLGAILGYFAISARPIPVEKAPLYVGLFLLGGVTLVISGLAPYCPQSLQFIFLLFPVDRVLFAVQSPTASGMSRLYGVAVSCMFGVFFMLARFGIRGIFSSTKPWRALVFLGFVMGVMLGGFRAFMLLTTGVFLVQFYLEGLLKMRFLPAWLVLGAFVVSLLPIADRLPYQMQRSLAWIPGIVSPEVAYDARGSTEWRLAIWRRALDELPQHLILGKGYALDLRDMAMVQYRQRALGGESEMGEAAELAGDGAYLKEWVQALLDYLEGEEPHLDLPLDVQATAFQRRVWEELRRIPYGETRTYTQVAEAIGRPRAVRAVGRACATNPVSLVIPCHRVVGTNGSLTGYRWGLSRKQALQATERRHKEQDASEG